DVVPPLQPMKRPSQGLHVVAERGRDDRHVGTAVEQGACFPSGHPPTPYHEAGTARHVEQDGVEQGRSRWLSHGVAAARPCPLRWWRRGGRRSAGNSRGWER